MRGDAGSTLTDQQKQDVLRTARDVYRDSGVKKVLKGLDSRDEEIWGWPYAPDLFVKSDITGRPCRFYVTLPDGRIAHPSELFPEKTRSQWDTVLDHEMARQRHEDRVQHDVQKSRESRIVSREQWVNGSEDPTIDLGVRENPRQLRNWFLQQAWHTTGRGSHGHTPELWTRHEDGATVFVDKNDKEDQAFFTAQGFERPVSENQRSVSDAGDILLEREPFPVTEALVREILTDYLNKFFADDHLPVPQIVLVRRMGKSWAARCAWHPRSPENTTIEVNVLQVASREKLEGYLAHELIHHWQYLTKDLGRAPSLRLFRLLGHGRDFESKAQEINAVKGADFVQEFESEASEVEVKEFTILVKEMKPGVLGFVVSNRLSARQKLMIQRYYLPHGWRLGHTKYYDFSTGAKIGSGSYSMPITDKMSALLKDIYDTATANPELALAEKDISIQDLRKATDPLFLRNKERSKDVHLKIAEITPTGTIVTLSNSVTLKKENHWRQSIKLLDWDEALAADNLSFPDRANLAVFGRLQVMCNCLTAETRIPLLDGRTLTMQELWEEYGSDKTFWVYASDTNGDFVPAEATCLGITGWRDDIVEVCLDNGTSFRCTSDELVRLRDGEYREAKDLLPNDSLMPLYRDKNNDGYEVVKRNSGRGGWDPTHRIVAQSVLKEQQGEKRDTTSQDEGLVVHHCNFDKMDNRPSNLQWMGWREHTSYHQTLALPDHIIAWVRSHTDILSSRMKQRWADPEQRELLVQAIQASASQEERRLAFGERVRQSWADPETRALREASFEQRRSLEYKQRQQDAQEQAWADPELRTRHSEIMLEVGSRPEVIEKKREAAIRGWADPAIRQLRIQRMRERWADPEYRNKRSKHNHKVVCVKRVLSEPVPVYDLTVKHWENFLLECGVFVHNCPSFIYWGYEYINTQLGSDNIEVPDYEGKKGGEKRYPKVRNPKLRGVICKHLTAVLLTLERSIPEVASAMASYARLGKIKVGSGKVQNAE